MAVKRMNTAETENKKRQMSQTSKAKTPDRLLKVKLVRSLVGRPKKQREVVKGLGLRRINSEVVRKDCPEIWGMIRKTAHLVEVKVLEKKSICIIFIRLKAPAKLGKE